MGNPLTDALFLERNEATPSGVFNYFVRSFLRLLLLSFGFSLSLSLSFSLFLLALFLSVPSNPDLAFYPRYRVLSARDTVESLLSRDVQARRTGICYLVGGSRSWAALPLR